ncbi:MAG TPA: hypothetical protein PLI61_11300 [bacterium]|nr:hypothetical protein [bacterium]
MMGIKKLFAVIFVSAVFTAQVYAAQRMDFMLFNLSASNDPQKEFLEMSKEFTAVMAPMFFGEAETRGSSGFEIGLGYSLTKINLNADYWKLSLNDEPVDSGVPPFYNGIDLHVSKGFGFGLKLYGNMRYYVLTEMLSGGGGFEYAINEGLKMAPDISIGGGYNRLFGATDFNMQMIELRLKISKTFVAGYQIKLIPFIAYSHLFSWAKSGRLGGYFPQGTSDPSQVSSSNPFIINEDGNPFYFKEEFINVDRIFIGFKMVSGYFGFELEAAIPVNAGKTFSFNAGISASM